MPVNMKCVASCFLGLLGVACGTVVINDDEQVEPALRATIIGNYKWRAPTPVNVYLRKVDEVAIGTFDARASVAPGPHVLLVDCVVGEPDNISRYVIEVEVFSARRYQLEPVIAPGNRECTGVELAEVPAKGD